MAAIGLGRHDFQIASPVIVLPAVDVIALNTIFNRPNVCFYYEPMNEVLSDTSIKIQPDLLITALVAVGSEHPASLEAPHLSVRTDLVEALVSSDGHHSVFMRTSLRNYTGAQGGEHGTG